MNVNNAIIIISGPTATGKTSVSIKLAKTLESKKILTAIVNFDSLLFYRELNIGTAKPSLIEQQQCEHHLIDITSAATPLNASDYIKLAKEKIDAIHRQGKVAILVGGSGFYLRALLKGMYQGAATDKKIKNKVETIYNQNGIEPLRQILKDEDPKSYNSLHANDHYRIMRAVEYLWTTNNPISLEKEKMDALNPYDLSLPINSDWNLFHCYLDLPKKLHYQIIQMRTKKMFEDGLLEEVKGLIQNGFTGKEKPLQSIGYKETFAYINNEFSSIDECMERISISTRQLAKSQRTWFKKVEGKNQYNSFEDNIVDDVINFLDSPFSQ